MLRLFEHNATSFTTGQIAFLGDASKVRIMQEINTQNDLYFDYPGDDPKAPMIIVNRIVVCEGQAYRIYKVDEENKGILKKSVIARHLLYYDARKYHVPKIPDRINVTPKSIVDEIFQGSKFHVMEQSELPEGLKWVGNDGFRIDFFSVDKTSAFDLMQKLIESCGMGELYMDNYKIALVERVGKETSLRLEVGFNMQDIKVAYETTDMITRLYPYGKDDAPISKENYIDSPNIGIYGRIDGYKDYTDYSDMEELKARAEWEFDPENEERIDVPEIVVSGKFVDLSKLAQYGDVYKVHLGDRVYIVNNGNVIRERIRTIENYPYEPELGNITIGRQRRDLFFLVRHLRWTKRDLDKTTTTNGGTKTNYLDGAINSDQNNIKSENERLKLEGDFLTIRDNKRIRAELGNSSKGFGFWLYDADGNPVIYFDEQGNGTFSGIIRGGKILSDTDIAVNKDANVGRYLRVGYIRSYENENGETIYEWYDDSNIQLGPGASISATNEGANLVFSALSRLELNAASVTKNGAEVATQEYIDEVMRDHVKNYHNIS